MDFKTYLRNLPLLHTWDGGIVWNTGGFGPQHLEQIYGFIRRNFRGQPRILETGAGNSTITFLLLNPERLISIAPEEALFDRIRTYCAAHDISTNALEFHLDGSEWVLPSLAAANREAPAFIDFALIDGCHNWPMVFLDFFYVNRLVREGGCIMLDDVNLHSVKELARLLNEQPGYELALDIGKSLIFRRTTAARGLGEWTELPYIVRRTDEYSRLRDPFAL